MLYELKLAVRRLRSQSLLTVVCVGIIALGIATTTALFSVTDGLLFKPLPFRNPERLMAITTPFDVKRRLRSEDLRVEREKLEASPLIAESAFATPGLLFDDTAAATEAGVVQMDISPNLFSMLGVAPVRGHIPEDANDAKAAPAEVLLGYGSDAP